MLTLVSKDSVKISDHFDVLCVLIACMVMEITNQMSKNQKSSLIVWNTVSFFMVGTSLTERGTHCSKEAVCTPKVEVRTCFIMAYGSFAICRDDPEKKWRPH